MGLASALNTALTGITAMETQIDVVGNNISNANTVGFKASRVLFATQFARSLSTGSAPTATNGGTNPRQIGLGTLPASIDVNLTQSSITTTSSASDLAIQGDGFFILQNGGQTYTRAGIFSLNALNELVNPEGLRVMGFGVDDNGNLDTTQLTPLTIPLGSLQLSLATQNVELAGILSATGDVATQGTITASQVLTDASTAGNITAGTLLTDVEDGGSPLFSLGETVTLTPTKGTRTLDPKTLTVGAGSTVQDLMDVINNTLGIQSGGTIPGTPGVTVSGGQIVVEGNYGTANAITISQGDLVGSTTGTIGVNFTETQAADGESAFTQFVVYDSLGIPVQVRMTAVLESATSSGTVYRFYAESPESSDPSIALSDGTITFDSSGAVTDVQGDTLAVPRDNVASVSPLQFDLNLTQLSGLAADQSFFSAALQDGAPPGSLNSFRIDESGIIQGVFDNGVTRVLGQVALARFANPSGLLQESGTLFKESSASGLPQVGAPGTGSTGTIFSGSLELSNTDVGQNLVDLILASTNYRSNTRVISAVEELLDELLLLGR